ncbi:MAG TPA: TAXI family TRAP transporter solute-binding subunit [Methyloceanibacter sp.]|nr:TAXI family TRAP transporter solute-binding subunit [Methyloceanibacter sp.]
MRIALAVGVCLMAFAAAAAPRGKTDKPQVENPLPSQSLRENYRSRLNENVVTIMAGSASDTDLFVTTDIAQVVDDGDNLRVLPIVGRGVAQNVKDVMFLRGVDMGITQANVLKHYAKTGELGSNFMEQVVYVAKLFNEEVHIVVRPDVTDIKQLMGKTVNLGVPGSGTAITARLLLDDLGINVEESHLADADAIEKLKSGNIAAAVFMAGKPAPVMAWLKGSGLKVLPIPYAKVLEDAYYPATLNHEDYPELIAEGQSVDTVSVCAVLVAFNWSGDNVRYRKVAKFVDAFFSKFDELQKPPRHPKWREVNFAATLEGWHRSPAAQAWINRAQQGTSTASKSNFDSFLAQNAGSDGAPVSDEQRAELFKAFLEWSKNQQ